ncbi:ubiquinol-cytochrome-c reductase complex assembly factor 1 isoform X1 [Bombus affinis]|uniref:ubiquinol-cytochrome-c reductase complex assembly factor 1 isoform X1 n=1 Tax=Bombus affinis TaxID=309941 RepID=UPI0021B82143|nr:ubiquinol-cytochrome-c reductase complex assembly factor 1 isoform X1 [Bombus affinis]
MMHCVRTFTFKKKIPLALTLKYITECKLVDNNGINFLIKPQSCHFYKNVHTSKSLIKPISQIGIIKTLSHKLDLFKKKTHLNELGYDLYGDIPDGLNYSIFYKGFNMPDTFFSWFLVTELHVWMLMVRFMAEGEKGKLVISKMVEAMWHDVLIRAELLGPMTPRTKKKQVAELSYQFNAAIVGYDEGIMSDDKVLASALWRRFFCLECNNPEHLEKLLIYVRKQIHVFDKIPSEKVFDRSIAKWVDL